MSTNISYYSKPFIEDAPTYKTSSSSSKLPKIKTEKLSPTNYDFKKYGLLRERILDKIYEITLILEDPSSSVNKSLSNIMRKNEQDDRKEIKNFIYTLNNSADNLLASDNTDSYEYFEYMKYFIKTIKKLSKKLEYYIYKTDSIDNFNIQEAIDTLYRFLNDFRTLDKAESKFPYEFRQKYVQKYQEKDFL